MTDVVVHTRSAMSTVITVQVVGRGASDGDDRAEAARRAAMWFDEVEQACSRFDPASELSVLCETVDTAVQVSPILFETTRVALAVAAESDGAFDPTIGRTMHARGFNRDHRTGAVLATGPAADTVRATYRDVHLDEHNRTIMLSSPLTLDLGAVAKGFAVDLAARELRAQWGFANFAIDAGGDLYLAGCRADNAWWSVGIRNPRMDDHILDTVRVSDAAVCTSGDYERRSPRDGSSHILDARTHGPRGDVASVTVIAPTAIIADALATAAFALGPNDGLALLERHELAGLIVTPELQRIATARFVGAFREVG